ILVRFAAPVLANRRMKNLFELPPLLRRKENYRAKCAPVQLPFCVKNGVAKYLPNLGQHSLIVMGESSRQDVGIEKLRRRQKFAQTFHKGCFSGGNSAC